MQAKFNIIEAAKSAGRPAKPAPSGALGKQPPQAQQSPLRPAGAAGLLRPGRRMPGLPAFALRVLLLAGFCAALSSCFLWRPSRLPQNLEGNIIPIGDSSSGLLGLKCSLMTGEPVNGGGRPPWTKAEEVKIETKTAKSIYKPLKGSGSLVYKHSGYKRAQQPGSPPLYKDESDLSGKKPVYSSDKDYINDFRQVQVVSIKDKAGNRFLPAAAGSGKSEPLNCAAFLSPDDLSSIYAKASHTYDVRFQIFGGHLRALLVAPAKDLPFHALPYSIKVSGKQERYAMPLGGYSVKIGALTESENADREATRNLTLLETPSVARSGLQARFADGVPSLYIKSCSECAKTSSRCPETCREKPHLRPSHAQLMGGFSPFKELLREVKESKEDAYPKRLFEGEWHYVRTGVSENIERRTWGFKGWQQSGSDTRIKIEFQKDNLIGYSLNTESANTGRGESGASARAIFDERVIFTIPIEHADYHFPDLRDQITRGGALAEVLNTDKAYWSMPFVKVKFSKIKLRRDPWFNRMFFNYKNLGSAAELLELTFSEDYFSFVLEQGDGSKARFSFLRPEPEKDSSYEPLILSERGWNLFPSFFTNKRVEREDLKTYSSKWQKSRLIERMHIRPDQPVIYRFTSLTPKDPSEEGCQGKKACFSVRDIGREVINLWNQVFEKADIPCPEEGCFVLKEDYDAELGDLRYHAQNFISPDAVNWGGGGGYGPSVSNFETGEILSATSNNYTEGMFSFAKSQVYSYIMAKMGLDPSFRKIHFQSASHSEEGALQGGESRANLLERHLFGSLMALPVSNKFLKSAAGLTEGKSAIEDLASFSRPDTLLYGVDFDADRSVKFLTSDEKELDRKYEELFGKPPAGHLSFHDKYSKLLRGGSPFACAAGAGASPERDGARPVFSPDGRLNKSLSSANYHLIDEICDLPIFYDGRGQTAREIRTEVLLEMSPHEKLKWLKDYVSKSQREARDSIIDECARKIFPFYTLDIAIHETGHNMAMMHNFAGTYDKLNFLKPFEDFEHKFIFNHLTDNEEGKIRLLDVASAPASSTTMDYQGAQRFVLAPGGYDVGFARFIYGSQLEGRPPAQKKASDSGEAVYQERGEIFTVDPYFLTKAGPNGNFEKVNNRDLRPYRRCMDMFAYPYFNKDPYCQMGDMGVSAEEIARNHYNLHVRERDDPFGFFIKMLPLYHEWRAKLRNHLDTSMDTEYLTDFDREYYLDSPQDRPPGFLEDFSLKRHKGALGRICSLSEDGTGEISEIADLCAARDILLNGLFDYLFHEKDHYCLLKHVTSDIQRLVSFKEITTAIAVDSEDRSGGSYETPGPFSSCYDVKKERSRPFLTWKIIGEFGRPLFDVEYTAGRNDSTELGRAGAFGGRFLSGLAFFIPHLRRNFFDRASDVFPLRLLDEPDARDRIVKALTSRLVDGESFKSGASYIEKTPAARGQQAAKTAEKSLNETAQAGSLNTRSFNNEKTLWRNLAGTLFLLSMPNPFVLPSVNRIQEILANQVRMSRVWPSFNSSSWVQIERMMVTARPEAYIAGESKEKDLSSKASKKVPVLIRPFSSGSHVSRLIDGLKKNDWMQSSLTLARKFREIKDEIFSNTYIEFKHNNCVSDPSDCLIGRFRSFIQDTGHALSALLAHPRPYVNALAMSLVYDYLEKGEFIEGADPAAGRLPVFISDFFASHLQNGWALHFEMSLAFKEKCEAEGILEENCARTRLIPYLEEAMEKNEDLAAFDSIIRNKLKGGSKIEEAGPESFMDKTVYELNSQEEGAEAERLEKWEYNPFKPRLELLAEYFKENPKELVKNRRLVFDLYAMEAFRSAKHKDSEVREALERLFSELKAQADSLSQSEGVFRDMREEILKEIDIEEKTAGAIKAAIAHLRNLRHFPNSHALQLIFVRDLLSKSRIGGAKISNPADQTSDSFDGGKSLEEEVYTVLSGKNPVFRPIYPLSAKNPVAFTMYQMSKVDQSTPPMRRIQADEPANAGIEFLKDIQADANHVSAAIHFHFDYEDTKRLFWEHQRMFKGGWLRYGQIKRLGFKIEDTEEAWFKDWLHSTDYQASQKDPEGASKLFLNPLLLSRDLRSPTLLTQLLNKARPLFDDNYVWSSKKPLILPLERTVDRLLLDDLKSQKELLLHSLIGRFFFNDGNGYSEPAGSWNAAQISRSGFGGQSAPMPGDFIEGMAGQSCSRKEGCSFNAPALKWLKSAPPEPFSIQ